jgi:hypothetical protein
MRRKYIKFIIAFIILAFLLILTFIVKLPLVDMPETDYSAQITDLQDQINKLEVEQSKIIQNVNKSLDYYLKSYHEEFWMMQEDLRIQNGFIKMQYPSYEAYRNERLKKVKR